MAILKRLVAGSKVDWVSTALAASATCARRVAVLRVEVLHRALHKLTASAAATHTAPADSTSTAAAAQSLTMRISGCCSGCSWSASRSMAVLNNSAAITALLTSSTNAHHTGAGR